jgi:hypothetical protein
MSVDRGEWFISRWRSRPGIRARGVFVRVLDGTWVERIEVSEEGGIGWIVTDKTGAERVTEPRVARPVGVVAERIGVNLAELRLLGE